MSSLLEEAKKYCIEKIQNYRPEIIVLTRNGLTKGQVQEFFEKKGKSFSYGQILYYLQKNPITAEELASQKDS
ncbi:MAG: hypothetical protein WCR55_07095 [Lentisphaerota bacterium]